MYECRRKEKSISSSRKPPDSSFVSRHTSNGLPRVSVASSRRTSSNGASASNGQTPSTTSSAPTTRSMISSLPRQIPRQIPSPHTPNSSPMTALITITPREDGQLWTTSLGTSGTYSVGDVARVLGTGQNRLFKFLKARGILRSDRTPRREYLRLGYFRIVRGEYQRADGIVCEYARLPKFILQKETSFAIFVLLSREIMMH